MKSRCVNIVVIVLSFPYLCAQAQDTLTVERNAVHIGDRVTSHALGISIVGNGGKGIIWDFSGADVYDNMRTYVYSGENEDSVIRVNRKSAETYVISRDSLLMVSEEDRLRRTDYLGNRTCSTAATARSTRPAAPCSTITTATTWATSAQWSETTARWNR